MQGTEWGIYSHDMRRYVCTYVRARTCHSQKLLRNVAGFLPANQGVVTYIRPIEVFATGIKNLDR